MISGRAHDCHETVQLIGLALLVFHSPCAFRLKEFDSLQTGSFFLYVLPLPFDKSEHHLSGRSSLQAHTPGGKPRLSRLVDSNLLES